MSKKGLNIYKRKDSRWEGRYPKGRKENQELYYGYVYGDSYKEVKEKVIQLRADYQLANQSLYAYKGTVREWFESWLTQHVAPKVKQSTYASYRHKLETYVFPYLGDKKLVKLTQKFLQEWVYSFEKKLSPSSIKVIFRVLQSGLESAKNQHFRVDNPCEGCLLPKIRTNKVKALSKSQQKDLVSVARQSQKGFPIMLALETGMRIGEICGLKWQDINFTDGFLQVQRTRQRVTKIDGRGTLLTEDSPKTLHSNRTIPLSPQLLEVLKDRQLSNQSQYVINQKGKPMEPRSLGRHFKALTHHLGWSGLSFHSLRHTFATRCVELGINIAAVSSLMGHSSIKTTFDTYTTTFYSEKQAAIQQLTSF